MKLFITFIRHGTTKPNTEGCWAGSVDIPITEEAAKALERLSDEYNYPNVDVIYRSPLVRCLQTMERIYPGRDASVIPEAREIDFGDFEEMNAQESFKVLDGNAIKQKKLDYRFPGGESFEECLGRGIKTIDKIVDDAKDDNGLRIALFTHAMWTSVLTSYCLEPPKTSEELFCGNGMGISVWIDTKEWHERRRMHFEAVIPIGAPRPNPKNSPYLYHGI